MKILVTSLSLLFLLASCQKEGEQPNQPLEAELTITSFSPDTIVVGGDVYIRGSGFDTTKHKIVVKVNDIVLPLVSLKDTLIVAKVPDNITTGAITISINNKQVITATNLVIVQNDVPEEKDLWTKMADFIGAMSSYDRSHFAGFSINGKGYVFNDNKLWQYDPLVNQWAAKATVPSALKKNYGFSFVINNRAYIGLGAGEPGVDISSDEGYKEVWEYNADSNEWVQKKNFPGAARVSSFSFSIGDEGFVGGGDPENYGMDQVFDFWKYKASSDEWVQLKNFPGTRSIGLTGTTVAEDGYLVEVGFGNPTALQEYKDVNIWKYNASADKWEKKAQLPFNNTFWGGTVFVIANKIYVGTGVFTYSKENGEDRAKDFWVYDPSINKWENKKDIGGGLRLYGVGFAIGDKGYLGLGTGVIVDDVKKDFWEYTP